MKLTARERRWLAVVFDAILPTGASERLPLGAAAVPLGRFVDEVEAVAPLRMRLGLRLALWAIVVAPLFVLGRLALFPWLAPADRLLVLERLRESPIYTVRELPVLLKAIACFGYLGLPDIQARVGIKDVDRTPPPWAREPGGPA